MPTTYTNPVIPGFHPDPSVCRVGADFYLVTSSFEYFPGVPLFHSTDLVHWRQLGHVLTRSSQLDLLGAPASGGLFAPTIRHHDGRFYVTVTNVDAGGHLIVWADDPQGPWSDPVRVDQDGIDPSLFFDEGRCYFTSTVEPDPAPPHPLEVDFVRGAQQCEIDPVTGEKLSETRFLWSGTGGQYPEAPHLYRRGDLYYLVLAEGGTAHGHMVTVARSSSPWGPWEPCPRNPVLTHRSAPSHVQSVGHADLVELADGSWWLVALATRHVDGGHHTLGRETFLAPVEWDEEGWPVVGDAGRMPDVAVRPDLPPSPADPAATVDLFDAPTLPAHWNTLRRPLPPQAADLTARPGALRLVGGPATTDDPLAVAVLRRQQHHACTFTAELEFDPAEGDEAGLVVRADEAHHIDLVVRREGTGRVVELRQRVGPVRAVLASGEVADSPLELRVDAVPQSYRFGVRHAGGVVDLGAVSSRYVSTEVAGGFTGVYVGMYAATDGAPASAPAWWTGVTYTPA